VAKDRGLTKNEVYQEFHNNDQSWIITQDWYNE
jgi:hypothetical protein